MKEIETCPRPAAMARDDFSAACVGGPRQERARVRTTANERFAVSTAISRPCARAWTREEGARNSVNKI